MSVASPSPTVSPSRSPSRTPTVSVTRTPTVTPSKTPAAQYDYILYLAHTSPFSAAEVSVGTAGVVVTDAMFWEYWNGTSYTSVSNLQETAADLASFQAATSGVVFWNTPGDWQTNTVNSQGPYYWMRIRSNTNNSTDTQALLNYIRLTVPPSPTPTSTPSISISRTPSITPSISISRTPTITPSISISRTPSITPSISISRTPTITPSISISKTPSKTPSVTPSISISPSLSNTPSVTPSITISRTPTLTPTITPSKSPIIIKSLLTNGSWSLSITGSPICNNTTYNTTIYFAGSGTYPVLGDRIYEYNNPDFPLTFRTNEYTIMDNGNAIKLDSGGYVIEVTPCISPSPTPTVSITRTPSITISRTPSVTPAVCNAPTLTSITENGSNININWTLGSGTCSAVTLESSTDNVNWGSGTSSCTSPRTITKPSVFTYFRAKMECSTGSSPYSNTLTYTPVSATPTPTRTPSISVSRTPSITPTRTPSATTSTSITVYCYYQSICDIDDGQVGEFSKNSVAQATYYGTNPGFTTFTCQVGDLLRVRYITGDSGQLGCAFGTTSIETNNGVVDSDSVSGAGAITQSTFTVTSGTTVVYLYSGNIS